MNAIACIVLGGLLLAAGHVHAADKEIIKSQGKYVLRATSRLHDSVNYKNFCTAFTANLNQFRQLNFSTCNPRLSPGYPQFRRPEWKEIPLDLNVVKQILTGRPSVGFKRWLSIYKPARARGEVKLWRVQVDLLKDGNLDTLVRLDHASDGAKPYCDYFDSKQTITDIPDPKASKWFAHAHFDNFERLGGDLIHDSNTGRYFVLNWNRYGRALGGGKVLSDIGATSSVMVSGVDSKGVWPVCWIDWVPAK